jgi:hypothetical protein
MDYLYAAAAFLSSNALSILGGAYAGYRWGDRVVAFISKALGAAQPGVTATVAKALNVILKPRA